MISDICQKAIADEDHHSCPIQISIGRSSENCQCNCHPGTIPATFEGIEMVDKPKNELI